MCGGGCCVCCSVAELSLSKPTLNNSSMLMHSRPHADNAHHGNMCWRMPGLHRQGQLVLAPRFFLLSICLKQMASLRMGGGGGGTPMHKPWRVHVWPTTHGRHNVGGAVDLLTSSRTWMELGVICCASFKELAASFSCPHMRKISAVLHHSQAQHSLLKLPVCGLLSRSLLAKDSSSLLEPITILGRSPLACWWAWSASRHTLSASWLPSSMDTNWIRLIVSLRRK